MSDSPKKETKKKKKKEKKVKVLGPTFEKGQPEGVDEGRWRQKLSTREEKLKYLNNSEGHEERYGSEKRKVPA